MSRIVPFDCIWEIRKLLNITNPPYGWRSVDEVTFWKALQFYDYVREGYGNCIYFTERGMRIALRFDTQEPRFWLAPEVFKQ